MKDRRIEKTRKALHEALVSLMAKKKYERIVVQDILDRANVGRSTFYMHYSDKDELLLDGLDRLWETLRQAQAAESGAAGKHERVIKFSLEWFRHTHGHRDLFKLLVGTPGWDIVRRRMEEMLIHLIKEEARPLYKKRTSSDDFELFAYFLGSGFVSVMTWWLNQKRPLPPEEIDVLFRQLVLPILSARLN
jgi:AcrR family transcriptional regulator